VHIACSAQGNQHILFHFLLWLIGKAGKVNSPLFYKMSCLLFSMLQKPVRVEVVVRSLAGWWEGDICIQFRRVQVIEFFQSCMTEVNKNGCKESFRQESKSD
jgi:hypothetical protein